jgi:hypothetical protein
VELEFKEMRPGGTMIARCSICKRPFRAIPKIGEKTEGTALRIRAEFDAHVCDEEASQAVARMMRGPTGDR